MIVTRFAPSPTGPLHLGHALAAARAHDLARASAGRFLLRIEDIDGTRSREEHVAAILVDLDWLGMKPDGAVLRQSARGAAYGAALARLAEAGLVYPCFCTRSAITAEIAASAAAPHGTGTHLYPGTCRGLPADRRAARLGEEPHAWRLDVRSALARVGPLTWHDAAAGTVRAQPELLGDVVLARKDAAAAYHLAVTVDDAAQGVSDVTRGDDLFESTHVHRLLQALLDLPTPRYHHHPLLTDAHGQRLSKRDGAVSLGALRRGGADPAAIVEALRARRVPVGFGALQP